MNAHLNSSEAFMSAAYTRQSAASQDLILPPSDDVEILSVADIIPDEDDDDMADRDILDRQFWTARSLDLEANMTKAAICHAWEIGVITAPAAIASLIQSELFDFDLVMDMLVVHSRTSAIIDNGAA